MAPAAGVGRRFDRARGRQVRGAPRPSWPTPPSQTLGELGFARTSLREIAQKTAFSHGVLHYYFRDKIELITYCVRRYKEHCVTRYDEIVEQATSRDELAGAVRRRPGRHHARGHRDAPALVRHARAGDVRARPAADGQSTSTASSRR